MVAAQSRPCATDHWRVRPATLGLACRYDTKFINPRNMPFQTLTRGQPSTAAGELCVTLWPIMCCVSFLFSICYNIYCTFCIFLHFLAKREKVKQKQQNKQLRFTVCFSPSVSIFSFCPLDHFPVS